MKGVVARPRRTTGLRSETCQASVRGFASVKNAPRWQGVPSLLRKSPTGRRPSPSIARQRTRFALCARPRGCPPVVWTSHKDDGCRFKSEAVPRTTLGCLVCGCGFEEILQLPQKVNYRYCDICEPSEYKYAKNFAKSNYTVQK